MNKNKYGWLKFTAIAFALLGFASLIITILLLFGDNKISWLTPINLEDASKIGDFVGGFIGIFWSISGILLLFLTLRLQSEEFKETRNAIIKQQFETTFFNMLAILANIRDQINFTEKLDGETFDYNSHSFLRFVLGKLKEQYLEDMSEDSPASIEVIRIQNKIKNLEGVTSLEVICLKEYLNAIYMKFYSEYSSELGHYLRYIFNVVKFTIDNRHEFKDQTVYIGLLQAQLSNVELAIIFYNCLSEMGLNQKKSPIFFLQMEKYSFLENIAVSSLLDRSHHLIYSETDFKFLNMDELEYKNKNHT